MLLLERQGLAGRGRGGGGGVEGVGCDSGVWVTQMQHAQSRCVLLPAEVAWMIAGQIPAISRHAETATGEILEFHAASWSHARASASAAAQPMSHLQERSQPGSAVSSPDKLKGPYQTLSRPAGPADPGSAGSIGSQSPHLSQSTRNAASQSAATLIRSAVSSNFKAAISSSSSGADTVQADGPVNFPQSVEGLTGSSSNEEKGALGSRQAACQLQPVVWFRFRSKAEDADYRREMARRACQDAMRDGWSGESVQVLHLPKTNHIVHKV